MGSGTSVEERRHADEREAGVVDRPGVDGEHDRRRRGEQHPDVATVRGVAGERYHALDVPASGRGAAGSRRRAGRGRWPPADSTRAGGRNRRRARRSDRRRHGRPYPRRRRRPGSRHDSRTCRPGGTRAPSAATQSITSARPPMSTSSQQTVPSTRADGAIVVPAPRSSGRFSTPATCCTVRRYSAGVPTSWKAARVTCTRTAPASPATSSGYSPRTVSAETSGVRRSNARRSATWTPMKCAAAAPAPAPAPAGITPAKPPFTTRRAL